MIAERTIGVYHDPHSIHANIPIQEDSNRHKLKTVQVVYYNNGSKIYFYILYKVVFSLPSTNSQPKTSV